MTLQLTSYIALYIATLIATNLSRMITTIVNNRQAMDTPQPM